MFIARGEEVLDFIEQYGQRLWPNVPVTDLNDKQGSAQLHKESTAVAAYVAPALKIETIPSMTQRALLKYVAQLPDDTALLALTLNSASDDVFYSTTEAM